MCELFGFSGVQGQDLASWLVPFRLRGGETGDNPDGWGVAWWDERGADIVKSPLPGCSSAEFGRLTTTLHPMLLIAHVRKARHPPVPGMLNTHPFAHVCCNRAWVFAHNGLVPEVIEWDSTKGPCQPLGDTDSEHAFCHLLTTIATNYDEAEHHHWVPPLADLSERIASMGKFNFLLSDGHVLIAYGHDRLHHLELDDGFCRGVVIATEPLTDEAWQPFAPGELRVYRDGARLTHPFTAEIASYSE
jgi:glutamine amidotransferase